MTDDQQSIRAILDRLLPIASAHAALPKPEAAGRHVGQKK